MLILTVECPVTGCLPLPAHYWVHCVCNNDSTLLWLALVCVRIWAAAKVAVLAGPSVAACSTYNLDKLHCYTSASAANVKDQLAYGAIGSRVYPYVPSAVAAFDKGPRIKSARGFPVNWTYSTDAALGAQQRYLACIHLVHLTPTMADFYIGVCKKHVPFFSQDTWKSKTPAPARWGWKKTNKQKTNV